MFDEIKKQTFDSNMLLLKQYSSVLALGNVSSIDRKNKHVIVMPCRSNAGNIQASDLIVTDFDGNIIEGEYKPTSELKTYLELYKSFPNIGGIAHTHLPWSTSYSQAGRAIKPYGTTHADYFKGTVPCTRKMTPNEINSDYELEIGKVIVETFGNIDYNTIPAVLVYSHGVFTWGKNSHEAIIHAAILENVAMMAHHTEMLQKENSGGIRMQEDLLVKHFNSHHDM